MRYLLDTHTLVWAVGVPDRLSDTVRDLLEDGRNRPVVSAASLFEMSLKHGLGKWPEVGPFMDDALYSSMLKQLGAEELTVSARHARTAGLWSAPHRDPFDRLLAAQSALEGLPLLSKDSALDQFAIRRIW